MKNVETLYSLSPLQHGLLFHSLAEPESRVYQQQLSVNIEGQLDEDAFRGAWERVIQRHPVLRTAFLWEGLDDAYQLVHKSVAIRLSREDWRSAADCRTRLDELCRQQQQQPIDLSRAPLHRLCLIRLQDTRWQFIWTHHHIVLDGWSVGLVLQDWFEAYRALARQAEPRFKPVRPYQDYIAWLGEQDPTSAKAFWKDQLSDFAEPTPLPKLDAMPPQVPATSGEAPCAERALTLDRAASEALSRFARSEALTPATLIAAAWGLLLARYAGREEALFGLTVSGRPASLAGSGDMVGLFINTLPLRVQCGTEVSIRDWLQQLQRLAADLQQRCYTPLSSLKALSAVPDGCNLFESIVVFENFPFDESLADSAEGLIFRQEDSTHDTVRYTQGRNNYPLTLVAVPGEGLELILCYRRTLLSDQAAAQMLAHLQALISALLSQADRPLSQLDWLSAEEGKRLLDWGCGETTTLEELTLGDLVTRHAGACPAAAALATTARSWSYAELDRDVKRAAARLTQQLAGPHSGQPVVALALPRSAEFIIATLACWKIGAAYLPLDVQQPLPRLRQILSDSGSACLIAAPELGAALGFSAVLSASDLLDHECEPVDQMASAQLDDIAYIIYTSGSTGQPKGVQISHRAATAYAQGLVQALALHGTDTAALRFGLVSTMAADLGLTCVFGAWASGACLCLPGEDAGFDPLRFASEMQNLAIDVLKITPSHLRGLLDALEQPSILPTGWLILGGEALDAALVNRIRRLAPDLNIVNHYGPTETTVGAVYRPLSGPLPEHGTIALGRPQPNRRLKVVDALGEPVPVGVPGELWIGGAGLAHGYLQQAELSAERFVLSQGERFYRSGDRVRWAANGELEFLGRIDRQLKLRGYRIEAGEIEARLCALSPQIDQALVRLIEVDGSPQLAAYVVARTALSTEKLRQDLAQGLPEYMVPSAWMTLDALPLNANGKVDVSRLPLPGKIQRDEAAYVAARDELEQTLAEIWQQVLRLERVGVHDNFFDLGGDSILNLQIVTRAQQRGLKLSPKQIFDARTIAGLVQALRGAMALPVSSANRILPLSAAQHERLQAGPLRASWRCLRLNTSLTVETLIAALRAVQAHHPGLQSGLKQGDTGWTVSRTSPFKAVSASQATGNGALQALADELLNGLDIEHGESMHGALLDGGTPRLLLLAHPLIIDEQAWSALLYDLALAIGQLQAGKDVHLSHTGGLVDDWVEAQQDHARSEALEPTWEEWLQYAGQDRPRLPLPDAASAGSHQIILDPHASALLDRVRRSLGIGWQALIATAVAQEANDILDRCELLIDLQAGRPAADVLPRSGPLSGLDIDPERLIGCLSHRLPLFLDWPCAAAPLQQIRHLAQLLQKLPLHGADYGAARYLSNERFLLEPLLALPEAQIGIVELADETRHLDPNGVLGEVLARNQPPSTHDLHIVIAWAADRLQLDLQGPLAERWSDTLLARLETLAAVTEFSPPPTPVSGIAELDAESLAALALDWPQVEAVFPVSPMQHGLLLESRLAAESGAAAVPYRVQHQYEWQGPLDIVALQQAWDGLHAQHAMLRSGFVWRDGETPLQVVYRTCDSTIEVHDWRSGDNTREALAALLLAERALGQNLERPPLDRLRLFQLAADRYVLARTYHHVLSDAWSFGTLIQELFERYEAARRSQSSLQPRGRPYRDYLRWLERQDKSRAEGYWRQTLTGLDGPTPLPMLKERAPATWSHIVARELWLGVDETRALTSAAQASQTTLNTWLQAAWALLLARYADCDEVVFGTTVAGRPPHLAGIERTVGLFINTLPLRVKLDPKLSLLQTVQTLLAHNIDQREFEHSALSDIGRWSGLARGQALFDSILVFENAPGSSTPSAVDYRVDLLEDDSPTHYPLSLVVMPGDRLGLRLYVDDSRMDATTAARVLDQLGHLLRRMPAGAGSALAAFEVLTPAERQQLLLDWNRSEADFPLEKSYGELLAEQARVQADKIAAVCRGETLSYTELEQRSNRVARTLIAAGAGPDIVVALLADRGLELLVMMIATLKAGAAFQALDTALPAQRLHELLQLGGAPILLGSAGALHRFQTLDAPTRMAVDTLMTDGDASSLEPRSGPDHLAYVVFTSGSTGVPKGAMVEQRGLLNNLFGKIPALGLQAQDRLAQTAALSFDISIWQFLAAPLLGATVHVLPDEIAREPRRLLQALDDHAITLAQTVPSMLRALLDEGPSGVRLAQLRWMISIGEALPSALCRRWFGRFPQVPLMNLYGPAECADTIGFYPLWQAPAEDVDIIPVGYPTANNQLHVLDKALRPLPVGVAGEICAAGAGVGRGYLNDPTRSAEVFVAHPFQAGARLYRTGDIGRYRQDGAIEYLGRRDQQIKIRGQRIELGEIESRITRHPAVAAAAVIVRPLPSGAPGLIAYWQAHDGADTAACALRAALTDELTSAQMPACFIRLPTLPLNTNGKTDRKALAALPLPDTEASESTGNSDQAGWSDTERRLARLWSALLGATALAQDSNFFELGGDSLLAAQLTGRVRSEFGVDLPLKALFEHPQLARLAQSIDQQGTVVGDQRLEEICAQSRSGTLPLSHAQQRLWFMEQLQPGSGRFNIPFLLKLHGPLDTDALQRAFLALVRRQEVLRTIFINDEGQPRQRCIEVEHFDLPLRQLEGDQDRAIRDASRDWVESAFDLGRAPLLRAGVLKSNEHEHVLAGAIHHIASDAWSISLLVEELAELYRAATQGKPPRLEPLTLHYADYAVWQRRHLQSGALKEQLAYWQQTLHGLPDALQLPDRLPATRGTVPGPLRYRLHLPAALAQQLERFAVEHQVSVFMLLHAAWVALMHIQTGRNDIVIGTDVSNRRHPASERMQGFFVNQLVLRSRVSPELRFETLLESAKQTVLAALQHQDLPFDLLVAELAPQRQSSESPLFQIKLVLQNAGRADFALPGIKVEELDSRPHAVLLDLQLNAVRHAHSLELIFDFDTQVYPETVVQQLAQTFAALLPEAMQQPALGLAELKARLNPGTATPDRRPTLQSAQRRRVPAT